MTVGLPNTHTSQDVSALDCDGYLRLSVSHHASCSGKKFRLFAEILRDAISTDCPEPANTFKRL